MQTKDMISAYQTLNQVAEAAGVVLFGSTTAANLPLNELLQDFGVSCTVYNRSVEGLTIEQAESYIQPCIAPLMPKMILLHFGEEEQADRHNKWKHDCHHSFYKSRFYPVK